MNGHRADRDRTAGAYSEDTDTAQPATVDDRQLPVFSQDRNRVGDVQGARGRVHKGIESGGQVDVVGTGERIGLLDGGAQGTLQPWEGGVGIARPVSGIGVLKIIPWAIHGKRCPDGRCC